MGLLEYQVIGRKKPTTAVPRPPIFRMRIFAPNDVIAKSRFWYFMRTLKRLKRANGELLQVNQIFETRPEQVKNYQINLRYQSRNGNHNITREFRDLTRTGAVDQLISDMAGRHRTSYRRIQIMEVKAVPSSAERRVKEGIKKAPASISNFHNAKIRFPLPHRFLRPGRYGGIFKAKRASTHFG